MPTTNKKNNKKKKRKSSGFLLVAIVVMAIAGITWYSGLTQQKKLDELAIREARLEKQIEQEQLRTTQLEDKKKYMQTKQYYEEVAKEKFGLIYEDEIIFKPKKD